MPNSEDLIAAARSWIGTSYLHQHREKGTGVDCVGLIIGAGKEANVLSTWTEEAWLSASRYATTPNPRQMLQAMHQFLVPIEVGEGTLPPDGSIALIGWRSGLPMHLAIIATAPEGYRTIIHAFSLAGSVVEHTLSEDWKALISGWWRYPDLRG